MTRFCATRILDRDLATLVGDRAQLSALEDRLATFVESIEDEEVDETDEHGAARTYVERLATAGLLQLVVPAVHGGTSDDVSCTALCVVRQWLARHSGALDTAFAMQGLGSYPIAIAGSKELRSEVLPDVGAGKRICAFAITEEGAGSDVSSMQTTATTTGAGSVRLDGEKRFISNAGIANSYVIFAKEGNGHSAFWLPGDAAGIAVEPIEVTAPHPIGTLTLSGVEVPATHRIGAAGEGLKVALGTLDLFRATVGAAALGLADRAMMEAVHHLRERVQFGKPLAKQQGLRFELAELATEHLAAQLLVYRAAAARDRGDATPDQPAMAKLHATETAQRVVDRAVQSLGGLGVTVGTTTERLYREVRALRIYEGTSEIQKLVIARALFDGHP